MSTPEAFYREVIDLNRYSNSVAGKYARAYNDIIIAASKKLIDIEFRQQGAINAVAPETRKRLRAIIKQSKDSLNTWSGESARAFKKELQGLAVLQTEFIEGELKKVVASGDIPINSVAVSTGFGDAVVSTDPTRLNLFGRPEEEFKNFKAGDFALTTRRGELLTLPNGETVEKAFRGIAARQQESLARHIRQGVLSGETNVQIARRLMGRLNFNEYAKEGTRAFALAGNEPLKLANHQIKTIVRTSINQVSNAASQSVYSANRDVAPEYEYVATLDSRTSSICQRLDGQKFGYDKGPTPPQHFNCRSTTVPVVDYEGLGLTPPPETKITTRPSETGRVPQKVSYGDWLFKQDKELQIKTLGIEKAKYFNRLAKKSSGKDALRQVIRSDGTELTLEQLKKKYGKPSDITIKIPKPKPVTKPTITITNQDKIEEIAKAARAAERKAKAELKAIKARDPLQPTIAQLQGISAKSKIQPKDVNATFDLMDNMEGLAGVNARKLRKFTEQRQCFCSWTTGEEVRGNYKKVAENLKFLKENPQFKKSMQLAKNRGLKGVKDNAPIIDPLTGGSQFNNIQRTKSMLQKIDFILEDGFDRDSGFGDIYFKMFATMNKKGVNCGGYTMQGANHINLKLRSTHKKITNLKKVRESIKEGIKRAADNKPLGNVDEKLYSLKLSKAKNILDRKMKLYTEESWLTTYVHEMGHQVHFAAGRPAMKGVNWIPSQYGGSNGMEQFAETFVQYIFDPVELKKASPNAYKWIEETLSTALDAPL
tara:strand:+ start:396 stop:2699 length:2304 start_codon:yes stop_codon:yes gene_type:complete